MCDCLGNLFTSKKYFTRPKLTKTIIPQGNSLNISTSLLGSGINVRKNKHKIIEQPHMENLTFQLKDKFICIFCGGANCKHEDYKRQEKPSAIIGLNSDLIDDIIFASQRPSNFLIVKYGLIEEFKKMNIGLIVNLQREGEHPFCGPNERLEESGFSYDPSIFEREGIKVYLAGWKDMSVPDSSFFMINIVKEMYISIKLNNNRVFVHCHAGYGRTGTLIACYFIYYYSMTAKNAVEHIRSFRSKCVEKDDQYDFCMMFEVYCQKIRQIFTHSKEKLQKFMNNQSLLYPDLLENSTAKNIPRLMNEVYSTIENIIDQENEYNENNNEYNDNMNMNINNNDKVKNLQNTGIFEILHDSKELNDSEERKILHLKNKINEGKWMEIYKIKNVYILKELLFDWIIDSIEELINLNQFILISQKIIDIINGNINEIHDEINMSVVSNRNFDIDEIIYKFYNECKRLLSKYELEVLIETSYFIAKLRIFSYEKLINKEKTYSQNTSKKNIKYSHDYIREENVKEFFYFSYFINRLALIFLNLDSNFNYQVHEIIVKNHGRENLIRIYDNNNITKEILVEYFKTSRIYNNFHIENESSIFENVNINSILSIELFLILFSNDMIFKMNDEIRILKKNNICISSLYNKPFTKRTKVKNIFTHSNNNEILQSMSNDLNQFLNFGKDHDNEFFIYFKNKYQDVFLYKNNKSNCVSPHKSHISYRSFKSISYKSNISISKKERTRSSNSRISHISFSNVNKNINPNQKRPKKTKPDEKNKEDSVEDDIEIGNNIPSQLNINNKVSKVSKLNQCNLKEHGILNKENNLMKSIRNSPVFNVKLNNNFYSLNNLISIANKKNDPEFLLESKDINQNNNIDNDNVIRNQYFRNITLGNTAFDCKKSHKSYKRGTSCIYDDENNYFTYDFALKIDDKRECKEDNCDITNELYVKNKKDIKKNINNIKINKKKNDSILSINK